MSRVVVVGGGPVGLAAAIHARLAGMEVVVLEQRTPKRVCAGEDCPTSLDKACGEGLMPGGVKRLDDMGVTLDPSGVHPFSGITWIEGDAVANGAFPHGPGLGIRRLHLHRAMAERAEALGVALRWGAKVTGLVEGGVDTAEGPVLGDVVLGADGLHSRVRRWAGLDGGLGRRQRFGIRRHFTIQPWTDRVEVTLADRAECYVTPVGPHRVGVAVLWSGSKGGFDAQMARFPRVLERLGQAPAESRPMGSGPLHQKVKAVQSGRILLVGDAAGYLDACTGEGLSLGFESASLAIQAVASGDLASYRRAHARAVRQPFLMMRGLLLAADLRLRGRLVSGLSKRPQAFGRILALNDGAGRPTLGDLGAMGASLLLG